MIEHAARAQAVMVTIGLFTFVSVGVAACLALVACLFWLVVNLVLVLLAGVVVCQVEAAGLWGTANPFCKILVLVLIAYGVYRLWRLAARCKGGNYAI